MRPASSSAVEMPWLKSITCGGTPVPGVCTKWWKTCMEPSRKLGAWSCSKPRKKRLGAHANSPEALLRNHHPATNHKLQAVTSTELVRHVRLCSTFPSCNNTPFYARQPASGHHQNLLVGDLKAWRPLPHLGDELPVGDHHGHGPEQLLQVVRQVRPGHHVNTDTIGQPPTSYI